MKTTIHKPIAEKTGITSIRAKLVKQFGAEAQRKYSGESNPYSTDASCNATITDIKASLRLEEALREQGWLIHDDKEVPEGRYVAFCLGDNRIELDYRTKTVLRDQLVFVTIHGVKEAKYNDRPYYD